MIDGLGGPDLTPLPGLGLSVNPRAVQLAVDDSGGLTDGDIYATQRGSHQVFIFGSDGTYLGR